MPVIDLTGYNLYWPYRTAAQVSADAMVLPASPSQAQQNISLIKTALEALDTAVDNISIADASTLEGEAGSYYLDLSNHTGSLAISSITNLQTFLDAKQPETVVQTTAAWAADLTPLPEGVWGRDSDLDEVRMGDGVNLWAGLPEVGAGSGHDAATLNKPTPSTLTSDTTLTSAYVTDEIKAGQIFELNRMTFVDSSGGAVVLTLDADTLEVSDEISLYVTDATSAITVLRPIVTDIAGVGTTNGTTTVAMADTSMVRVGDTVDGTSITSGQTVLSITTDTSITLSAVADGSVTDDALTFTGRRGLFDGSETFTPKLREGPVHIKIIGNSLGIDARFLGSVSSGYGPIEVAVEAEDFTMDATHFGKEVFLTEADAVSQTVVFPKPSVVGASYLAGGSTDGQATSGVFTAVDLGATSYPLGTTGGSVLKLPDGATAEIVAGGKVGYVAYDGDTWIITGTLVPTP